MKLALLVVAVIAIAAIAVALWLTRDELDTLPRDVDDDIDWLAPYREPWE